MSDSGAAWLTTSGPWQVMVLGSLLSAEGDWTLTPQAVREAVALSRAGEDDCTDDMLLAWRRLEDRVLAAESGTSGVHGVCLKEILKVHSFQVQQHADSVHT